MMKIKKDFVKTEAIGDTFVVVPVGENSEKMHCVITLNETASLIYDCIEEGFEENDIVKKLLGEYNVSSEQALIDVKDTVKKLTEAGVVE